MKRIKFSAKPLAGACLACLLAGCTSMGGTSGDGTEDDLDRDQAVFFSEAGGQNCAVKSLFGALFGGIAGALVGATKDRRSAYRCAGRSRSRRGRRLRVRPCRELPV